MLSLSSDRGKMWIKGDSDGVSSRDGDCGLPGELGGGWIPVPFAKIEAGRNIAMLV